MDFAATAGMWWLQQFGRQQQRSQYFGHMALVRVLAAVLASAVRLRIDEAGWRFRVLVGCGPRCWRRVIRRSSVARVRHCRKLTER